MLALVIEIFTIVCNPYWWDVNWNVSEVAYPPSTIPLNTDMKSVEAATFTDEKGNSWLTNHSYPVLAGNPNPCATKFGMFVVFPDVKI